jgi:hypothetical protein
VLVRFSHGCDKIPDKKELKEGRIYGHPQFERFSSRLLDSFLCARGEGEASWWWECVAENANLTVARKQREERQEGTGGKGTPFKGTPHQ